MNKLLFIGARPIWLELLNELSRHYKLHFATAPSHIRQKLSQEKFAAVVAGDLTLPAQTLQLCQWLKTSGGNASTPLLLIGPQIPVATRVFSFNQGVSDILMAPVDPRELLARLRVRIHEREYRVEPLCFNNLILLKPDEQAGYLIEDSELRNLRLTGVEYKLLSCLMCEPDRVWSRDELFQAVRGGRALSGDRNIDVHISNLRKKLGQASCYLRSIYGVGYALAHERGAFHP